MKIIRLIIGTIISIIAVAIATKLAAIILTALGIAFFLLKMALIVAIVALIFWGLSRVLGRRDRTDP